MKVWTKLWTRTLEVAAVASLVAVLVLLVASPAFAADGSKDEAIVIFNGDVRVGTADAAGDVVAFNGSITIDGDVDGNVVALNGPIEVAGDVTGDVVALNGRIRVAEDATIGGNVQGRFAPIIEDGASVDGNVGTIDIDAFDVAGDIVDIGLWLAISFSTLVLAFGLVLFLPRASDQIASMSGGRAPAAIGWGLALFIGIPIVGALFAATLIGLPLGVGLLLLIAPLYAIGYTIAAYVLGRSIVRPPGSRYLAALVGVAIMRGVALLPVLGGLTWFGATVFGLGIIVVATAAARPRAASGMPAPVPGLLR
ncbi:MAG: hypothetical protein ACRDKT_03445 [Actinomycetota bacterium]